MTTLRLGTGTCYRNPSVICLSVSLFHVSVLCNLLSRMKFSAVSRIRHPLTSMQNFMDIVRRPACYRYRKNTPPCDRSTKSRHSTPMCRIRIDLFMILLSHQSWPRGTEDCRLAVHVTAARETVGRDIVDSIRRKQQLPPFTFTMTSCMTNTDRVTALILIDLSYTFDTVDYSRSC